MPQIERNIWEEFSVIKGHIFYFKHPKTHRRSVHSSLEEAQIDRREFDWEKDRWTRVGINNSYYLESDVKSHLATDPVTGGWYAYLRLENDILVSRRYKSRHDAIKIKKYLDKHNWSIQALNKEIKDGIRTVHKYNNIIPTRKGYVIMDSDKKEYGCFEKLEDAYNFKKDLEKQGELL